MTIDPAVFKAYDVRGLYPQELDEDGAEQVGAAFIDVTGVKRIAVGHDTRLSSPRIAAAFVEGALEAGADVTELGLCATEMLYFAVADGGYDAGACITASHNPPQYTGVKMVTAGAVPLSGDGGIGAVGRAAMAGAPRSWTAGKRSQETGLLERFVEKCLSFVDPSAITGLKVVTDSVLLREGVARLLEEAGFEVVAQSGTAEDLLRHVAMHKPDVAVVDIRMPPTHTDEGLRAAREIRERYPDVGVLLLSQYVEPSYAMALLETSAEGVGYLLKDRVADLEQFGTAVRRVADGGSALDPAVVSELVGRKRRDDPLEQLTAREREVLELMAEGRSNQAIAERLFVTLRAVEKHVTSIFTKLGLPASTDDHRRVLAVLAFLRA